VSFVDSDPRRHRRANFRGAEQPLARRGNIPGDEAGVECVGNCPLHRARLVLQAQRVAQEQCYAQDRGERVCNAFAGDVGRRTVDRFTQS